MHCRDCLSEHKLAKPSDPASNSNRGHHHHHHRGNRVAQSFYQHSVELFGSLFRLTYKHKVGPIELHKELLAEIGAVVVDNLVKSDSFDDTDLKMKVVE